MPGHFGDQPGSIVSRSVVHDYDFVGKPVLIE